MTAIGQLFHNYPKAGLANWTDIGRFNIAAFNTQPALTTALYGSLTGELASGQGYATRGLPLNGSLSPTTTETEASGWPLGWTLSHTYALGDIVTSSAAPGYLFMCGQSGVATGSAPTTTTVNQFDTAATVTVGSNTSFPQFVCVGTSVTVFSSQPAVWTATTGPLGPAQWFVIWDTVTGYNAVLITATQPETAETGSSLTITPNTTYGWTSTLPR